MIAGCPSCGGEGWIPIGDDRPLSHWENLGVLSRYRAPIGELIVRDLEKITELNLTSFWVAFKQCWCHHQLVQIAMDEGRPLFYEDEESGQLAEAVDRYFGGVDLNQLDLIMLKAYIGQWTVLLMERARATFPQPGSYESIPDEEWLIPLDQAANSQDLREVLRRLLEAGIDPF